MDRQRPVSLNSNQNTQLDALINSELPKNCLPQEEAAKLIT